MDNIEREPIDEPPPAARHLQAASPAAPRVAPSFWLHVDGELRGQIVLDGLRLVVGRGEDCDVILDDATVSGDHLALTRYGGAVVATDLGSSNGTVLNGRRLDRPTRLRHGDTLVLGRARLQLVHPPVPGAVRTEPASSRKAKLTDEERDVARALVAQFRAPGTLAPRPATRAEIADAVSLSDRTVQRRLKALSVKLALPAHASHERAHLLAQRIIEHGIDGQR